MAGTKIVTRKLVTFQGEEEEFSNVYYFGNGSLGLSPDEDTAESIIQAVIDEEKLIFSSVVRFLGGSSYHMGVADTPGDTDAIARIELAATGNQGLATFDNAFYRECAVDIKWLLGGRRYLRSMLHTCIPHGLRPAGDAATAVGSLSPQIKEFGRAMLEDDFGSGYKRIAPNGDRPTAVQYNPYLEHRQFHRYKRRNTGLLG